MIVSYDIIMSYKPPYHITPVALALIQDIAMRLGQINFLNLQQPPTVLRRENRIKSIHSSLAIEGNSLSLDQVTALINQQKVIGNVNDIIEVKNAIAVYDQLHTFKPTRKLDLLKGHKMLMQDLITSAGEFRKGSVGIVKGDKVAHLAPPYHLVPDQIKKLLSYLKHKEELTLIKSCVFHYEFEFIHPFQDGNGRMGRLWQTLILMQEFPVFQFTPIELMIKNHQQEYYQVLAESDKVGHSTPFIEFMLLRIKEALDELLQITNIEDSFQTRISIAKDHFANTRFSRIDYMKLHKKISTATASRDLKKAIQDGIIQKEGEKNQTRYRFSSTT